jgi:hypothetical protein
MQAPITVSSTLNRIRTEVRRIARVPDPTLMTNAQIDDYVNTFYLYDMPMNLRLFNLREVFTFYTVPNVDTYRSQGSNENNDFYEFKNLITAIHPPVFMGGQQGYFTQYRDAFYSNWSQVVLSQDSTLRGNGTTGTFTGIINSFPLLQNNVSFSALDINNIAMNLVDYPIDRVSGNLALENQAATPATIYGTINYLDGTYSFNFPRNTLNGAQNIIYQNFIPYKPGRPSSMLYFDDAFVLRPVPDRVYPITVEADIVPTELLDASDNPKLNQWWQYIALGTCLKIFRSRMDMNSFNLLYPEFKEQETMIVSRSDQQQVNCRTQTLITRGKLFGGPWTPWGQGNVFGPY